MDKKSRLTTRIAVALFSTMLAVALLAGAPKASAKDATQNMLLVELFTSQGCSSCPPADKLFSKLAEDENLAVLAWHVPYWNYIGWKDPFSLALAEKRQRQYARRLQSDQIYTPQAVIAAREHYVGSDKRALEKSMRAEMKRGEDNQSTPQLKLVRESSGERNFSISIEPAKNNNGKNSKFNLSVVIFQASASTDIKRGENRGKTLREANIVREVKEVGGWDGRLAKKFSFRLPEGKNGFDVLRDGGVVVIAEPNDLSGDTVATRWDFKRGFKPESS